MGNPNARATAHMIREVTSYLSLSLEAVDTQDKYNCIMGVGEKVHVQEVSHYTVFAHGMM